MGEALYEPMPPCVHCGHRRIYHFAWMGSNNREREVTCSLCACMHYEPSPVKMLPWRELRRH